MNQVSMSNNKCSCPHHKIIPILVIVFGIVALLGTFGVLSMYVVDIIWPILVIIAGVMHLTSNKCKCC